MSFWSKKKYKKRKKVGDKMSTKSSNKSESSSFTTKPADDPVTREAQLINLAVNLAERQLREGTASSQIIAHFLKQGSTKERLEMERLEQENKLLKAKTEVLQAQQNLEETYAAAIEAMKSYKGGSVY